MQGLTLSAVKALTPTLRNWYYHKFQGASLIYHGLMNLSTD
ncbi:hypothetical protein CWATWH8502_1218 [Crocosphaera watsonii WH 8502]|uniref:Uncharacterized protein n=5 Tax=Crocosphaera watsonii TaxID=263511 RepID=T2JPG0_CROWT|nr:hypothetical protein CWATWH0003_0007 [Crocosphaera watsonii WH 0003]CCQ52701.1 hypothetical protein CWATWH8502_1218 [Crocosphaera watsonii WH 8502]CCQ58286.1 hypothetical protein CWATWH0005_768 [Crocosphaera watsonii WH 0005]CCQ60492.1 hypothetical protein CWATWH0401_2297 [Crocosphaera watsonii WH 0401]CCQ66427.1 hypothetical protein CWATWH0402_3477 [Crocosphaera watsonii WH 0402]